MSKSIPQVKIKPRPEKLNFFLKAASILFLVDFGIFYVLGGSIFLAFLAHSAVVLTAFCLVILALYLQWDVRFAALLCLFSFLGPLGIVLCLLTLCLYALYSKIPASSSLLEALLPERKLGGREELYHRLTYGMEDLTSKQRGVAFHDIMSFGTSQQKRSVIEKILKYFNVEFSSLLLQALNDPSPSVRIYAATAMNRLDNQFYNRFLSLLENVQNQPNDSSALLALAKHCEEYAGSKILDEGRTRKMWENAMNAYENYVKLNPADWAVPVALGRIYLTLGMPQQAHVWLEDARQKHKGLPQEAILDWCNCLYQLGRYADLREFCKNHGTLSNVWVV